MSSGEKFTIQKMLFSTDTKGWVYTEFMLIDTIMDKEDLS